MDGWDWLGGTDLTVTVEILGGEREMKVDEKRVAVVCVCEGVQSIYFVRLKSIRKAKAK